MNDVIVKKQKQTIPTYVLKKANDLPMFFENKPYQGASGRLYPIPYSDGITDEKTDVDYETYIIENEYIKTVILPEIGGKILRGYDKVGAHDFIYYNESALIHSVWYLVVASIGLFIGSSICKSLNRK